MVMPPRNSWSVLDISFEIPQRNPRHHTHPDRKRVLIGVKARVMRRVDEPKLRIANPERQHAARHLLQHEGQVLARHHWVSVEDLVVAKQLDTHAARELGHL